jgi:cold shock CspA family protein
MTGVSAALLRLRVPTVLGGKGSLHGFFNRRRSLMLHGQISVWFPQRRYGFIRPNDSPEEIFFHMADVVGGKPLPKWSRVSFEMRKNGHRTKAVKVQLADETSVVCP